MGFKSKWKRFWTLTRKASSGFTLVELVVVIAILAILAGVGSVAYSGYIKSANKGNDKTLVGNVMRAIETGTYSTAFVPSESLTISATSYPVGFVVLSTEGTTILTSGTTVSEVEGECEFETATVAKLTTADVQHTCGLSSETKSVTTISYEEIQYCTTHGAIPTAIATDTEYVTNFTGCSKSGFHLAHEWNTSSTIISAGTLVAGNDVKVVSTNNSSLCEYAYANQNGIFTGSNVIHGASGNAMDTTHPLYQAIYAAYGDLSGLKLKYDGWTSDEGVDFATFYSGAPGVMSSMESLSGILAWLSTSDLFGGYVEGEYANEEEVLSAVTDKILTTHSTKEEWLAVWNSAGDKTWDSEGFGLSGRENYSAVRMAYNTGFATYLSANGVSDTYCSIIKNFNAQEILGYGMPGLVCTDAFTDSASPLKGKFESAGDSSGEEFNKVADLFEKYKNSETCSENGQVFYNTMITFDETEEFATDPNNIYGGDMFDYYNAYVNEISALYTEAQNAVKDGSILIIVTVNNGELAFQVSPSAANPRND